MDDKLRICDCPLCLVFLNPEENIKTKLYWPETIEEVSDAEFVIIDNEECNAGMIILGEHITDITRECWGRILYRARHVFGANVRLRIQKHEISDHWHSFIVPQKY